ncbi:AAA family ATPase [Robbsia sp. Bb-Pol-6]|uniref:AAA family ATPase n=1 Tax=Robbsia betulipollinis TaxID=2981849 RepID=A0ABT3ZSG6_9BURK|nr:AAA family ATPase [Robbsia betulipollinis]MCY0389486.1 AAA family ATPase [Robbsia betulipollinis]
MIAADSSLLKSRVTPKVTDFIAFVADREAEQVLQRFVLEQAMPHVHIALGGIDEAIAYLEKAERSPLFLMVDLHRSAMPLSDLGRLSQVCEPSVQVVALGERNDVGLFRSLLKIGIRDYLVKPLTVELLSRTVDLSHGRVTSVVAARVGKVIGFAGARGGVGVTTLTVNLARYLAEETHRRVAYIDLNLHGGAANTLLALKSNNGLIDVLQNVHRLDPQYVERTMVEKSSRLFVLSAEMDLRERITVAPGALARILEILSDSFHYVLLDIHDPAALLGQEAFDHASRAYIVTDATVHAARQTTRLLRYIENRDNNPPTSLVLNHPNAIAAGKVGTQDIVAGVGRPILHEIRFEPKSLSISENLGESLRDRTQHGFRHAIKQIANDLTGQRQEPSLSLMQKLRLRGK